MASTLNDLMASVSIHIPGHGKFACSAADLDLAIMRYLPGSVVTLRAAVDDRVGETGYSANIHTVTALLIVLASFDQTTY